MIKFKLPLIFCIFLIGYSLCCGIFSYALTTETITQEDEYCQTLSKLFIEAASSIDIVIDTIVVDPLNPSNPVNKLVDELAAARVRGVQVRVILEEWRSAKNFLAYKHLLENGIDVYFDSLELLKNSKAIIIDSRICVISSPKWSAADWRKNPVMAAVFDSPEMAGTVQDSISKVVATDQALTEYKPEGVLIPDDFLLLGDYGRRFLFERMAGAFDLYLVLIKEAQERASKQFPADYEKWGRLLSLEKQFFREFISEDERKQYFYSRIRENLKVLSERYGYINYDEKTDTVTLQDEFGIDLSKSEAAHPSFILPDKFWEAGLSYKLSLNAKYAYLISLCEAGKSRHTPYWFSNIEILSGTYGMHPEGLASGLEDLEEINLIEIAEPPAVMTETAKDEKNIYMINRIMTDGEFNKKIEEFKQKYGEEITKQALKQAGELNEPRDIFVIEIFINLIQKYSYEAVRRANIDTLRYERGSSLRHISTTIKSLEKEE